jgi:multidrug efflux pump subunit AcrB
VSFGQVLVAVSASFIRASTFVPVAASTILVKRVLKLVNARGFILLVAGVAALYRVSLLPDVLAVLVYMVAISALGFKHGNVLLMF